MKNICVEGIMRILKSMKISILSLFLIIILAGSVTADIPVVINELMASNRNCIHDSQGQYDDWIELYNYGTTSVNISGMYLTDNLSTPTKWQIPSSTIIPAGGYLLIWADDDTSDNGLHANFKLDTDGEEVGLFDSNGTTLIDGINFTDQKTDVSFGRVPDAGDDWYYFSSASPGSKNEGGFPGIVADTKFSPDRGFYDTPFYVTIITETVGAIIVYTTDGSKPTETNGQVYAGPVLISTTTCLRAAAFSVGWLPTDVDTHTYIFLDDVAQQPKDPPGWPDNWGSEPAQYSGPAIPEIFADYEMDPRVVNNTLPGYSVQEALLDIPSVSIAMEPIEFIGPADGDGLWSNPRIDTEYECSMEYIPVDDSEDDFQEDCKVENHGFSSTFPQRMNKHNLRLTFTSEYGAAKLRHPLFPDSPVETFNQLILRAFSTDSWALVSWVDTRYRPNDSMYMRDVWMKESLLDMGQPSSYGRYVHLYVNGLYFGLFDLTESVDEAFCEEHFGGEKDDWTVGKDFSGVPAYWNTLLNTDVSTLAGYEQSLNYIDIENFADYMLLHFYADAEDWPHHNGIVVNNTVSGDGKMRFFVWDQAIVLDNHGLANSRIDNGNGVGAIFQHMRTSAEFRLLFADRVQKHCFNGGALSLTGSQNRYLEIANEIDKAIVAESARWGDVQMSTTYGHSISQPNPLDDINHRLYPPVPNGPDYYFTREDSWIIERDNVINNYIPAIHDTANSYALINVLRAKQLFPNIDAPVFHINGFYQHGGQITDSDELSMAADSGEVYYTLDGSDPRIPGSGGATYITTTILLESAAKKALVPTESISEDWKSDLNFDDSSWASGTSGVGYERGSGYQNYFDIDVEAEMYNGNTSCYIRIPFTFENSFDDFDFLMLNIRYDDGFIAYINGTEVARSDNAPSDASWNSMATGSHDDSQAVVLQGFGLFLFQSYLQQGQNILAIHGLNTSPTSSDFLISAELVGVRLVPPNERDVSPSAFLYSEPISISNSTKVKARVRDAGIWSALNEATYAVGPVLENLRITEIMYHPLSPADTNDPNEEYIELKNVGSETINLNLVKFTNGIDFTFPSLELAPDEFIVVVEDVNAFENLYGTEVNIAGQFTGRLASNGERIRLEDAIGRTILDFSYQDDWYDDTDGQGYSLTVKNPLNPNLQSWSDKSAWRSSDIIYGSPGWDDSN